MYGVLHIDGTFEELPKVDSASIEGDELVCRDRYDRVVARYTISEAVFGKYDALKRIAPFFRYHTSPGDSVQSAAGN
jgi:hypothetical protein